MNDSQLLAGVAHSLGGFSPRIADGAGEGVCRPQTTNETEHHKLKRTPKWKK